MQKTIERLEAKGYVVIPPQDIPEVIVNEGELLATIDGLDWHDFAGGLLGRSVAIGTKYFDNHSVEYEYRRVVAHVAMLLWYRDNLEAERAIADRATEILRDRGIEKRWLAKKGQWRSAIKQARRERKEQS